MIVPRIFEPPPTGKTVRYPFSRKSRPDWLMEFLKIPQSLDRSPSAAKFYT